MYRGVFGLLRCRYFAALIVVPVIVPVVIAIVVAIIIDIVLAIIIYILQDSFNHNKDL